MNESVLYWIAWAEPVRVRGPGRLFCIVEGGWCGMPQGQVEQAGWSWKKYWLLLVVAVSMCFIVIYCKTPWIDLFYMIATGRDILSSGECMHTATWLLCDNLPVVVQNWAWCVAMAALYDVGGFYAIWIVGCVLYGFMLCIVWWFGRLYIQDSNLLAIVVGVCAVCLADVYLMRPQCVTFIILMEEWILLERWRRGEIRIWRVYIALAVMSIWMANVHASFHPFLIGILGLFVFPDGPVRDILDSDRRRVWLRQVAMLIDGMILVVGTGLLNPYGIDALLYLFRASQGDTGIGVYELTPPAIMSFYGMLWVSGMVLLVLYFMKYKKGVFCFHVVASVVFLCFVMMHRRNYWMIAFVWFPLVGALTYGITIRWRLSKLNNMPCQVCCGVVSAVLIGLFALSTVVNLPFETEAYDSDRSDMPMDAADYLDTLDKSDVKLFTTRLTGNYMEFRGYSVYIDVRLECYQGDLLDEWASLYELDMSKSDDLNVFIEKYGFTHFLFADSELPEFEMWIREQDWCQCVVLRDAYRLYERID